MMHPRNKLAVIFSPTRRLIGPEPRTVRSGGLLGELQWVVPRADCEYRRLDYSALPAKQRAGAARIAARRHAAGPARFHVAWNGPVVHLWTWAEPDAVAAGVAEDAPWLPESLLRAPPASDGLRILCQVDGFEGQAWRDGDLQVSQWWPDLPQAETWRRFVRACGLGPEDAVAVEPESLPWSESWADRKRGVQASPAVLERWAWRVVVASVVVAFGWQFAAELRWRGAQSTLESRMDTLRAKATPLLAAREQAERARDAIASLRQLQQGSSDYRLASGVIAPLPPDTRFVEWQREGGKLQVAVRSSDADPRHFVSAYDGDPVLDSVVATPGEAGITMLAFDLARTESAR
jgi:hypothetical protein